MAQPLPYARSYSFQDFQTGHPSTPLPGDKVNAELDAIAATTVQIRDRISRLQRDDLALANDSVGFDQLRAEVVIGFNPPSTWATATAYIARDTVFTDSKFYVALESHTSGTFATDLAAGLWEIIADFTAASAAAVAAQTAAELAETNAETAQAAAEAAQAQAITSAANAATSASSAATSSASADAFAAAAAGSASDSAASATAAGVSAAAAAASATAADGSANAAAASATEAAASAAQIGSLEENLQTLAGITPGAAGLAILADATPDDVRDYLDLQVVPQFATKAAAEAYVPNGDDPDYIRVLGLAAVGDYFGSAFTAKKEASEPSHDGKVQIGSGAWYSKVPASPREPVNLAFFVTPDQGSGVDCTPGYNKCLAYLKATTRSDLFAPGAYFFKTVPDVIDFRLNLRGIGGRSNSATVFNKWFAGLTAQAPLMFRTGCNGSSVDDLTGYAPADAANQVAGAGGSSLLSIVSDGVTPIGYCHFNNVDLSSEGDASNAYAYTSLYVDGTAGSDPLTGVRVIQFNHLKAFGGEIAAAWIQGTTDLIWNGGGCYLAGGKSGRLLLGGTATQDDVAPVINVGSLAALSLGYVSGARIDAKIYDFLHNTADTHDCIVTGPVAGAVQDNWIDSIHVSPKGVRGQTVVTGSAAGIGTSFTTVSFGKTFASAPKVFANSFGTGAIVNVGTATTTGVDLAVGSGTHTLHWMAVGTLA